MKLPMSRKLRRRASRTRRRAAIANCYGYFVSNIKGSLGMAAFCFIVLTSILNTIVSTHGTTINYSNLLDAAEGLQDWSVTLRRDLHKIPELGFEELKTGQYVRDVLESLGVDIDYPIAKTGIVGSIGKGEPVIALRADMDALPLQEDVELPYKSTHAGKMHACGHDAHTAMLLGAARLLKEMEGSLSGTVLLVFQPAEEALAGGRHVVESGALSGVTAVHGLHVWPGLRSGVFASRAGTMMAASTRFHAVVRGHGGHAGMPHLARDPVIAAAAIVHALQPLVSRETDPVDGAVISVTRLSTGEGATNVIPYTVEVGGSLRGLSQQHFYRLIERATEVMTKAADMHGCTVEVSWRDPPYIPTVNNLEMVGMVEEAAKGLFGPDRWQRLAAPTMAAEDFGFMAHAVPGAFTFLGIHNETAGSVHGLHTPRFQLDESVLHLGAALHAAFALQFVSGRTGVQMDTVQTTLREYANDEL